MELLFPRLQDWIQKHFQLQVYYLTFVLEEDCPIYPNRRKPKSPNAIFSSFQFHFVPTKNLDAEISPYPNAPNTMAEGIDIVTTSLSLPASLEFFYSQFTRQGTCVTCHHCPTRPVSSVGVGKSLCNKISSVKNVLVHGQQTWLR